MKFLIKSSYKNNFNYFYSIFYNYYRYDRNFIKNRYFLKKTHRGVKLDPKLDSSRRFRNIDFNNQFLNMWLKKGLKLRLLKHFNLFLQEFKVLLINDATQFKDLPNYNYVIELLNTKYYYYKFENLLDDPFEELEYVFDLKIKKLGRKLQKKLNKKYEYKVFHIHKHKRVRYIIKLLYFNLPFYKQQKYFERMYNLLINLIFDTKELEIWKRRADTYKVVYKQLIKK